MRYVGGLRGCGATRWRTRAGHDDRSSCERSKLAPVCPRGMNQQKMWSRLAVVVLVALIPVLKAGCASGSNDNPAEHANPGGAPRWYKGNLHTHSLWSD